MPSKPEAYFGLPQDVVFCKRCVMSNQRPSSYPEFKHTLNRVTPTMHVDEEGICDACRYAERKPVIDWKQREEELLRLLDRHRRDDGHYDCLVPGSGGKDSAYAAHILKYKYGMNPLTVTWAPTLYTEYGYRNFQNWVEVGGFDNILVKPSGRVHCLLTQLSVKNLLHPFQTFILGQKNLPPKIAVQHKIPLIFYGEPEAEYGNPIAETNSSLMNQAYYSLAGKDREIFLGGVSVEELKATHGLSSGDLSIYLPPPKEELQDFQLEFRYLGYYLKWTPQEAYYYATEHTGFQARPFRTVGTYSKYASIDDKIDDFHFYTTFIKFGIGRATYDASQEIRNKHLTREEGMALVKRFDGEYPERYMKDVLEYLEMSQEEFDALCDRFRSPHLWTKVDGQWKLRHAVYDAQ